jgi:hypothetical protein
MYNPEYLYLANHCAVSCPTCAIYYNGLYEICAMANWPAIFDACSFILHAQFCCADSAVELLHPALDLRFPYQVHWTIYARETKHGLLLH